MSLHATRTKRQSTVPRALCFAFDMHRCSGAFIVAHDDPSALADFAHLPSHPVDVDACSIDSESLEEESGAASVSSRTGADHGDDTDDDDDDDDAPDIRRMLDLDNTNDEHPMPFDAFGEVNAQLFNELTRSISRRSPTLPIPEEMLPIECASPTWPLPPTYNELQMTSASAHSPPSPQPRSNSQVLVDRRARSQHELDSGGWTLGSPSRSSMEAVTLITISPALMPAEFDLSCAPIMSPRGLPTTPAPYTPDTLSPPSRDADEDTIVISPGLFGSVRPRSRRVHTP